MPLFRAYGVGVPEMTNELLEELAERFKALSEPSRLSILKFLMGLMH